MTPEDYLLHLAALRYALGRQSYIVHVIRDHVMEHVGEMSTWEAETLARDIREARDRGQLGNPRIDAPLWLELLQRLEDAGA